jgi:competence protein ComGC
MNKRIAFFIVFTLLAFCSNASAGQRIISNLLNRVPQQEIQAQYQRNMQTPQAAQQMQQEPQELQELPNQITNESIKVTQFSNSSLNPVFESQNKSQKPTGFNTIKTLVPYEDLYKVLQKDIGKYFIIPINEFEKLKKAKEAWLASESKPLAKESPLLYRINSSQISGKLEENFARLHAKFKVETFTEAWHEIPLMWGSIAIESVRLNGKQTTLKTNWGTNKRRQVNFGKLSQQRALQNIFQMQGAQNDTLSQNNWKDAIFSIPLKGKGVHECSISFMVPIQNKDDLYTLQFNLSQIPLTFFKLEVDKFTLSIDSTSFKDYSVDSYSNNTDGCTFVGWLGANSNLSIKWRRKFTRPVKKVIKPKAIKETMGNKNIVASEPKEIEEPKPVIQPLVYARSETLISLGETAIQGYKTINYNISKAPVSSFTFEVPEKVEIGYVNSDRPQDHQMIRKNGRKYLIVDFLAGREDSSRIEFSFESPVDLEQGFINIPEIIPANIEREIGTVAIEALTSVEVQAGNDDSAPLGNGIYPLDPLEVPQPLRKKASRPILLAYKQNSRPANIRVSVKRYDDVNQQTVVADSMEVKTTFTTNKTSNTLLNLQIRNNNKQYLQLQLASGSEVISAFRNGKPVKLVAGKSDGKVQIPLLISQSVGKPVNMNLQLLYKEPIEGMKWHGNMEFATPLVDIPISRFSWYLYSPEQFNLFDFKGTVKDNLANKDPFFFKGFMVFLRIAQNIIMSPDLIFVGFILFIIVSLIAGRKFLFKLLRGIWNFFSTILLYIFSGKGFRLAELMIVAAIIAVLVAIAIPNFRKARMQARDKACYANMRVIQGAVEMYNMDQKVMMKTLNIDQLVKGGYLKSYPSKPERGCHYLNSGNLDNGGYIYCQLHGSVEGPETQRLAQEEAPSFAADKMVQSKASFYSKKKESKRRPSKDQFRAPRTKGMLPIKTKFVMTSNFYALERDLVIADIATDGALLANRTCPKIKVRYVRSALITAGKILSFVLALFSGLYFISGAFFRFSSKITFAAIIILALSVIDFKLQAIGFTANLGLWTALLGGIVWKTIWLLSQIKIPEKEISPKMATEPSLPPELNSKNSNSSLPSDKDGIAKTGILFLITLLCFVIITLPAFTAKSEREIRVMAPFKELSKVIPTGDRVVIIPEDDYNYLKDILEPKKPEIISPQAYRFESVHYSGVVEEKGVRFSAEFNVHLFNKEWKKIGLLSRDAIPSHAKINGQPLALHLLHNNMYGFMTNATGTKRISLNFFIPLSSSEYKHTSKFTLKTVPVCLSTLEILIMEKDCEAWIDPGVLKPALKENLKTTFKAILPPTDQVRFELYRNIPDRIPESKPEKPSADSKVTTENQPEIIKEKTRISVRESNLLYFKEGFVTGLNEYRLKIKGGVGIATFSFNIPKKLRILKVESKNKLIEDWKCSENGDRSQLELTFKSRLRGETKLFIEFEQDLQHQKDTEYLVPEIIPNNVEQSFGMLGIGCLQTLEVSVADTPQGFSPIIAAEFLKEWKRLRPEKTPYAFKFLRHPNRLKLSITRPEDIGQQTAVIDRAEAMSLLNEDGYLLSRIIYEVRNNSQQFLKVRLPQIGSYPTELWSTQVAGMSVRAGLDKELGVYNLPIVRSPRSSRGESKSFPVEIVYAIKTKQPLKAVNKIFIELPQTHLPVSELSWQLYLPEGYELMRETGNVDRRKTNVSQKFLNNSSYFSSIKQYKSKSFRKHKYNYNQQKQQDRVFGMAGMMPVKFKIPTTSWVTSFTMLQIEPEGKAPYIEGTLLNPRKGKGHLFQLVMILIGVLAGISFIKLFTGKRKYLWFLFLALQGGIIALTVYLKLYQADHFAQMGFSSFVVLYLFHKYFAWQPAVKEE